MIQKKNLNRLHPNPCPALAVASMRLGKLLWHQGFTLETIELITSEALPSIVVTHGESSSLFNQAGIESICVYVYETYM